MIKKTGFITVILMVTVFFVFPSANATSISLIPANTSVFVGDMFNISILADIDEDDAIIAFGFDLDLSGTGSLAFNGFTSSPLFGTDLFHEGLSDEDGILGATLDTEGHPDFFWGTPAWGTDLLLGTLSFTAIGVGNVLVDLGADDLNLDFTEGLISLFNGNFMPEVFSAEVNVASAPVPEPATILLLTTGLLGMGVFGRKKFKK